MAGELKPLHSDMTSFDNLPDGIIRQISSNLPSVDLCSISKLNQRLYGLSAQEMSTRSICFGLFHVKLVNKYKEYINGLSIPVKCGRIFGATIEFMNEVLPLCPLISRLVIIGYSPHSDDSTELLRKRPGQDYVLPHLETLTLHDYKDIGNLSQINFFEECPNLRSLNFLVSEKNLRDTNAALTRVTYSLAEIYTVVTQLDIASKLELPFPALRKWNCVTDCASSGVVTFELPYDIRYSLEELHVRERQQVPTTCGMSLKSFLRNKGQPVLKDQPEISFTGHCPNLKVLSLESFSLSKDLLRSVSTMFPGLEFLNLINVSQVSLDIIVPFSLCYQNKLKISIFTCPGVDKKRFNALPNVKLFTECKSKLLDTSEFTKPLCFPVQSKEVFYDLKGDRNTVKEINRIWNTPFQLF